MCNNLVQEGGVAVTANTFFYYFYDFTKGCPTFVRSEV
jgi:hypothetical protein